MTILLLAALSVATVTSIDDAAIGHEDWHAVATAARRMELPATTLYDAMTARVAPRRDPSERRFCVRRQDIVPAKSGMVCRTRAQWTALGIDIDASQG